MPVKVVKVEKDAKTASFSIGLPFDYLAIHQKDLSKSIISIADFSWYLLL